MEMKASRMVADRVAISNAVLAAVDNHGPEVAPKLDGVLFPNGFPSNLDMAGVLDAVRQLLAKATNDLVNADTAHAVELQDDDPLRRLREDTIFDLRGYLVSLRSTLSSNYGPEIASAYGCGGNIPDDPHVLARFSANIEELLRSRPLAEAPKKKSLALNAIEAADDLKSTRETLEKTLNDLEREKREAQLTQSAKNAAMTHWATAYPRAADTIAALFALAGHEELANKVKPTAKRRAGIAEEGEESPAAPPPGATPPAAPGPETPANT